MKKSIDIIGLPVVDISEGIEIGTVKKLVINATEGSIVALAIVDDKWYLGAKLLPFAAITALGESAITIINSNTVLNIGNAPDLEQLLITDVAIIGTKVLTKTGRIQGTVKEILTDITGKIIACEIEEINGEMSNIPAQRILTFGKKVLIITDENEIIDEVATPIEELSISDNPQTAIIPDEVIPEVKDAVAVIASTTVKENANDDSAKKFDEKQRKYLLGKQASRRIETDNGVVIVEQGGEISEEVLQKAKLAGKFVELSMNIQ